MVQEVFSINSSDIISLKYLLFQKKIYIASWCVSVQIRFEMKKKNET